MCSLILDKITKLVNKFIDNSNFSDALMLHKIQTGFNVAQSFFQHFLTFISMAINQIFQI